MIWRSKRRPLIRDGSRQVWSRFMSFICRASDVLVFGATSTPHTEPSANGGKHFRRVMQFESVAPFVNLFKLSCV
jgi:hypothetical protein